MSLTGCEAKKIGPGQITSNSEMAMCLLPAENNGVKFLNLDEILAQLAEWRCSDPCFLGEGQRNL